MNKRCVVRPASRLEGLEPYSPPDRAGSLGTDLLKLDLNEGPAPVRPVLDTIGTITPEDLRRYPDASKLETEIAQKLSTEPSRVLVTNGGDDAIDRACRAFLEPGRTALLHTPTFEMIPRGIRLAGSHALATPWVGGPFPVGAFLDSIRKAAPSLIALVSPNNPTGGAIPTSDIINVACAAPRSLILVDLAYIEFADEDPTTVLLDRKNVMLIRTFSKARGLAGLRVGYAVAAEPIIRMLRTVGSPFPVSVPSIAAARESLRNNERLTETVQRVRTEREALTALLTQLGASPLNSQANFVTARIQSPRFLDQTGLACEIRFALARNGISIRGWPGRPELGDMLRITLPCDQDEFNRLTDTLTNVLTGTHGITP